MAKCSSLRAVDCSGSSSRSSTTTTRRVDPTPTPASAPITSIVYPQVSQNELVCPQRGEPGASRAVALATARPLAFGGRMAWTQARRRRCCCDTYAINHHPNQGTHITTAGPKLVAAHSLTCSAWPSTLQPSGWWWWWSVSRTPLCLLFISDSRDHALWPKKKRGLFFSSFLVRVLRDDSV